MKNIHFLAAAIALLVFPATLSAQVDEREPGLYAVVNGEYRRLPYSAGGAAVSYKSFLGTEMCHETFQYEGATSGVIGSSTLVLVVDPQQTKDTKSLSGYVFNKNLKPGNMMIVPLFPDFKRGLRRYDSKKNVFGSNVKGKTDIEFSWSKISDNSYEVKIPYLWPGEFGIFFRQSAVMVFDCCRMFGFTVPESGKKGTGITAAVPHVPTDSIAANTLVCADSLDAREPGIYAIVGSESIPLGFESCAVQKTNNSMTCEPLLWYKGISSGINASDTFVLVINPKRIGYMANYPFIKTLTPSFLIIMPLDVNQESLRREYDLRKHLSGKVGADFEWKQISLNSYEIKVSDLQSGEYAISTRIAIAGRFDYNYGVFGFSIP